ncbi:MAG: TIGR01777 family oxidoreductase [Phycisphaeraceae bacterium]|nr:TIGR01777 family oxidoreductase [Phycisphaeraceae bacterium]
MATSTPHIVIPGGSGFLGQGLARSLEAAGYAVTVLGRAAARPADLPETVQWRQWDGKSTGDWVSCLDGAAAVVNLVGRSVDCRKTPENKREILESRTNSCHALGQAMRAIAKPPPVWIQSATAHIVGDPEPKDTICDESTPPGPMHEMAPSVGVAWEKAFYEAKLPEQRDVVMRISFVLGPHGGAMARLTRLTRLGLGGTIGSGRQWISWIHQDDLNRLIIQAIEDDRYRGVYMVTAPEPITNRRFMRTLRRVYRRPWSPPAPALGVRLAARFLMNTDPELALLGRRCVPARLIDEHGFAFRYPKLDDAVEAMRQAQLAEG